MRPFVIGTLLFCLLNPFPGWAQTSSPEPPPAGKKLIEIYRVAPGQHEAFLRAIALFDEVNRRAGLPPRELYVHSDGASWDFILIQDATYPAGAGEAVGRIWDELRLPSGPRFFTEFRRFVLEHTDTFAHGPTTAGDWLERLDAMPPTGFDGGVPPAYRLQSSVALSGNPRWDYLQVDGDSRRLFLAHDAVVEVIDLDSFQILGQVTGLGGAHGIALAPTLNLGFVANSDRDSVTSFSLSTLEIIDEIAVGNEPDSVTFEPITRRLAVWNGGSQNVSVLDAVSLTTVATLPLGATPEFAVADGRGSVFANLEEPHRIVGVDMSIPEVARYLDLEGCLRPHGLAIDPLNRRLYSACSNELLLALDADSGSIVGRASIGADSDAVVFDSSRSRVYVSSGEGFVSVIDLDLSGAPRHTTEIQTRVTGRTMAVDPLHGTFFVPAADLDLNWSERQAAFAADGLRLHVYRATTH